MAWISDKGKEYCCTWDGQYRLKKIMSMFCGVMVIISSIFALLDVLDAAFNLLNTVKMCWNLVFGILMLMHEFKLTTWITLRFGFLNGWFGRGMFYLFVGTTVMGTGKKGFWHTFSYAVGFCCIFIGVIELLFGFKCASSETAMADEAEAAANAPVGGPPPSAPIPAPSAPPAKKGWFGGSGGRAPTGPAEPSLTVNVTPGQVAGAAGWAANNAGTVAAVANAAQPAVQSAAASNANPFFGNNHLNANQQ